MTVNCYPCHGVHEILDKGRSSGELKVSDSVLVFYIKDQIIKLSTRSLSMKLGGASNRLVFFSHPSKPDWSFYTSDLSILKDSHLVKYEHLNSVMVGAKKKRVFNWSLLAAVAAVVVGIPFLLITNMDIASKAAASQVPVEWEYSMGEKSYKQYSLNTDIMDQKEADKLLSPLIQPLIKALPDKRYDYHFFISNDSSLNAFALPGGYVVINSGLILAAESAEEVLGVVGHEITHVRERHGIRNVISSAGTYLLVSAILGDVSGLLGLLGDAAPILINQGYSRKFESEADDQAFELMVSADINPIGLAHFFEKLIAKKEAKIEENKDKDSYDEAMDWLEPGLAFLSSHPGTQERVDAIEKKASGLSGTFKNFNYEFTQLQEAVSNFVTEPEVLPEAY